MSCKLSYPVTTANVKRAKSVARVDTAMEDTGRSTATEVCGDTFWFINHLVKEWRESTATVIIATANTVSARLATEDVEVTDRSLINIIIVTSCVITLALFDILNIIVFVVFFLLN